MKNLFFTVLVAIVAVGGAYSKNYYVAGETLPLYFCPTGLSTCDVLYGSGSVYGVPAPYPPTTYEQGPAFQLSSIPWLLE